MDEITIADVIEVLLDVEEDVDYERETALVDNRVLDSFDIISLTSMLEEKYGITIDGLDIVPENYASIDAIIALVEKSGRKAQ